MMNRISLCTALLCSVIAVQAPAQNQDIMASYKQAMERIESQEAQERKQLMSLYAAHMWRLKEASQQEGDLDPTLMYMAEAKAAEEGTLPELPPDSSLLIQARKVLQEQEKSLNASILDQRMALEEKMIALLSESIVSLTQAGDMESAKEMDQLKDEAEARLASMKPALEENAPEAPKKPLSETLKLGNNIVTAPSFSGEGEERWNTRRPNTRNGTEIFGERNSERNKAMRFQQFADGHGSVHQSIPLKAGKEYLVRFRTRLMVPWKKDILMRGKGKLGVSFRVPGNVWRGLPPAEQMRLRQSIGFSMTPPDSTEWRWVERKITARKHMSILYIRASAGEGEFLVDDVTVQEIQKPPKK